MKTRESRLQNGKVVYNSGISFTKQESHLQNGILGVQTGLSGCYLPHILSRRILCDYIIIKYNEKYKYISLYLITVFFRKVFFREIVIFSWRES